MDRSWRGRQSKSWMDVRMDGWMDGWMHGWRDGWTYHVTVFMRQTPRSVSFRFVVTKRNKRNETKRKRQRQRKRNETKRTQWSPDAATRPRYVHSYIRTYTYIHVLTHTYIQTNKLTKGNFGTVQNMGGDLGGQQLPQEKHVARMTECT